MAEKKETRTTPIQKNKFWYPINDYSLFEAKDNEIIQTLTTKLEYYFIRISLQKK